MKALVKYVLVQALQLGYFGEERRREGEKFVVEEKDFFFMAKPNEALKEGEFIHEETGRIMLEDVESGGFVYKTKISWADLVEDDYQPHKAEESTVIKKKAVLVGNMSEADVAKIKKDRADAEAAKKPVGNPKGFAASQGPKAAGVPAAGPAAPVKKAVAVAPAAPKVEAPAAPEAAPAAQSSDDVI